MPRSETHGALFTISPELRTRGNWLESLQEVYIIVKEQSTDRKGSSMILLWLGEDTCVLVPVPPVTETLERIHLGWAPTTVL